MYRCFTTLAGLLLCLTRPGDVMAQSAGTAGGSLVEWSWITGSNIGGARATVNTLYTPDPLNSPGMQSGPMSRGAVQTLPTGDVILIQVDGPQIWTYNFSSAWWSYWEGQGTSGTSYGVWGKRKTCGFLESADVIAPFTWYYLSDVCWHLCMTGTKGVENTNNVVSPRANAAMALTLNTTTGEGPLVWIYGGGNDPNRPGADGFDVLQHYGKNLRFFRIRLRKFYCVLTRLYR